MTLVVQFQLVLSHMQLLICPTLSLSEKLIESDFSNRLTRLLLSLRVFNLLNEEHQQRQEEFLPVSLPSLPQQRQCHGPCAH